MLTACLSSQKGVHIHQTVKSSSIWVLHIGPPHRSLGIPRNFREFPVFFEYFRDFWLNIRVFGQNNVIFELLQQKWCRIIMSFRQNTIFGPETYQIWHKYLSLVAVQEASLSRTCPGAVHVSSTCPGRLALLEKSFSTGVLHIGPPHRSLGIPQDFPGISFFCIFWIFG